MKQNQIWKTGLVVLFVMLLLIPGCGKKQEEKPEQETLKKQETVKDYIKDIEDLAVVEKAEDVNLAKAMETLVADNKKDQVASIEVNDKQVDYEKKGTYPVEVMVTLTSEPKGTTFSEKQEPSSTSTKQGEKKETGTDVPKSGTEKKDTKAETPSRKEEQKELVVEEAKEETQTNKKAPILKETVSVEVISTSEMETKVESGKVVIQSHNEIVQKEKLVEKKKEEKKEDSKKEEAKKEEKKDSKKEPVKEESKEEKSSTSSPKQESQKPVKPEPQERAHVHVWVSKTKTVHHEAIGHNEQYVIKEGWDETVNEEVYQPWSCCNVCGADCTADPAGHAYQHAINGEGGGHHTEYFKTVTKTIHHEPEYGTRWVEDSPAWDETVEDGYICNECGATK